MQGKMQRNMQSVKSDCCIRWLICLVAATLIIIAMTGFAAAETKTGTVATTALNLRSGPGSNYSSLGLISINKEVTILDETYDVSTTAYNFADWETSESNRSDMFSELDQYLSPDLDLITIQLGENITTGLDTLNEDYTELVQYIKDECPNAQIMILDEFCWPKPEIQAAQKQAADTFSLTYIDLSEIRTDEYRAGLGTNVMGEDNEWHTITEATVAEHPNDDGMRYIANRIIANLSQL